MHLKQLLIEIHKGDGARARALRSSLMIGIGFGGSNVLRLASNLILTRLLFPEAFGLMSLVFVFLTGFAMLSDLGLNISIIQNKRGEEPDFLNTAWSLQIIRGVVLWLCACAMAYPAALIYDQPQLAQLLPVVGLTSLIAGFTPTKVAVASRNLQIGVQIFTDLGSQIVALAINVLVAWLTGSVWALVAGTLVGAALKVIGQGVMIKGATNRWHLDRAMVGEMVHFGKYIFLASIAGFLVNQSDRAILGAYVSMSDLGVFTVAYMFATMPLELARAAGNQIIMPLFVRFPPSESPENRQKVLKARRMVSLAMVALSALLSLGSIPLIGLLYDDRYQDAGPLLTLLGFGVTAQIAVSNYDGALLGAGDSKKSFQLISTLAVYQVIFSLVSIKYFATLGAAIALLASTLITYSQKARAVSTYNSWDPRSDLLSLGLGWAAGMLSLIIWYRDINTYVSALLY